MECQINSCWEKVCLKLCFWRAPTHADIDEFENILLQLKNQRPGQKAVWGFCLFMLNWTLFWKDVIEYKSW